MQKTKKQLNNLLVDLFNQILILEEMNIREKGIDLSMTEIHVLDAIARSKNNTMSNVATKLMVTQGTLTVSTNKLIKNGYIEKYQDEKDKRVYRLKLTKKGKEIISIHDAFHSNMIEAAIKDLKLDDNEVLLKSLENISDFFANIYSTKIKP